MMGYNTKNYREQGGDKWVVDGTLEIGGTLEIKEGAEIIGLDRDLTPATELKLGGILAMAKDGGDVVEVKIGPDAKLYVPKQVAENQLESVASTPQEIVDDFNALLQKLKAAGIMEPDE